MTPDVFPLLAHFPRLRTEGRRRLALLADLHLSHTEEGSWRVENQTPRRLKTAVEKLNEVELDHVIFAGDLTQHGYRDEHQAVRDRLERLHHPWSVIPGNHDIRPDGQSISTAEFEAGYGVEKYPARIEIGDLTILMLNTNADQPGSEVDSPFGYVSEDSLEWLQSEPTESSPTIAILHHHLPGTESLYGSLQEEFPRPGWAPPLQNASAVQASLTEAEVDAAITGHVHFPAVIANSQPTEISLPPLGPFPGCLTLFEFNPSGLTLRLVGASDNHTDRIEALVRGFWNDRVLISAAQLADLPLYNG